MRRIRWRAAKAAAAAALFLCACGAESGRETITKAQVPAQEQDQGQVQGQSQAFGRLEVDIEPADGADLPPDAGTDTRQIQGEAKTPGQDDPAWEALPGISIDTESAESVSVYYGAICYSLYSEEREAIDKAAALFTGFELEEAPDGQLDGDTTYQVYFSARDRQIAAVNVDKNGMFYLPEQQKFYKVSQGVFHYGELDKLYRDSMNADGVNENQCLIQ